MVPILMFSGKILYENGLKNSDITLEENNFILVGEVKSKSSVENIRLELTTGECTDTEKNILYLFLTKIHSSELIG